MMKQLVVVSLMLGALACEEAVSRPKTPEAALQAFTEAMRKGDPVAVQAVLTKESRAAAEKRAGEISAASNGLVKNEPMLMVLQTGFKVAEGAQVKVSSQTGDRAVLEVTQGTSASKVTVVKEEGGWAVDVTPLFVVEAR